MVKPIPDNVKDLLSELSPSQQVVLRSYIATLRSEIVSFEEEKLNASNEDPHAHYHGDVKCTADHGHVDTKHNEHYHEHVHTEHCQHDHDHQDNQTTKDGHNHDEHGHEREHTDHGNDHKEHHHDSHDHSCEHDHGHGHGDTEKVDNDIPAWKKSALGADPTSAPFGGNWQSESNVSAAGEVKKHAQSEE